MKHPGLASTVPAPGCLRRRHLHRTWLAIGMLFLLPSWLAADEVDSPEDATSQQQVVVDDMPSGMSDSEDSDKPSSRRAAIDAAVYDRVMVVGQADNLQRIPGSAHVVSSEELAKQQHSDIHRILRQLPGVYLQEEDGFGLRPNIGLRGTGVERSSKVTLMEDGVLIAPAPYSAPSAYYFPTAGRMESIEVRKGSAAIRQGPFTNGGVINFVSSSIPGNLTGRLSLTGGDHNWFKGRASVGGSYDHAGFLFETFQQSSSGFKELDGGGDTGFELEDYLLKVRLNTSVDARFYQELEIKLGKTEQDGEETYLGLTQADFDANPYRRYRGSALDSIVTDHEQVQLRHYLRPNDRFDVTTTLYRNNFSRAWYKTGSTLGISNSSILNSPEIYADALAILRGEVNSPVGAVLVRDNNRDYVSEGIQSVLGFDLSSGATEHRLEIGLRYHEDEEDRFQRDDRYSMIDGQLQLAIVGAPGSQANRIAQARALAIFVEDRIEMGRLTVTPGVRFETLDTRRLDYGQQDPSRSGDNLALRRNSLDVVTPGLGVDYRLSDAWSLFAGAHRGFAPPSPSSTEEVEAEESVNYEAGTRFSRGRRSFEAVLFWNDYSNLLGNDTLSGGGTGSGDQFNGGGADVRGLELGFRTDLATSGMGFRLPFHMSYTYTEAEFASSFETGFADWAPRVTAGDSLPYVPENQLYAELGIEGRRWNTFLSANYVDEMRTQAGQGPIPLAESIEDHLTFDLAAKVELWQRTAVFLQVRNLSDEVYVASRRPDGLRPGLPRTTLLGFSVDF